jgi:hypothetical protein
MPYRTVAFGGHLPVDRDTRGIVLVATPRLSPAESGGDGSQASRWSSHVSSPGRTVGSMVDALRVQLPDGNLRPHGFVAGEARRERAFGLTRLDEAGLPKLHQRAAAAERIKQRCASDPITASAAKQSSCIGRAQDLLLASSRALRIASCDPFPCKRERLKQPCAEAPQRRARTCATAQQHSSQAAGPHERFQRNGIVRSGVCRAIASATSESSADAFPGRALRHDSTCRIPSHRAIPLA